MPPTVPLSGFQDISPLTLHRNGHGKTSSNRYFLSSPLDYHRSRCDGLSAFRLSTLVEAKPYGLSPDLIIWN